MGNVPWLLCVSEVWPPHYDRLIFQSYFFFSEIGIDLIFQKVIYIVIHFLFTVLFMTKKCTDDFIMREYYVEMET